MIATYEMLAARRSAAIRAGDSIARDAYDLMIAHVLGGDTPAAYAASNPTLRSISSGKPLEY